MSAIVGERDRLLRSTIPRNINPTLGKYLDMDVDPVAVHVGADGVPTTPVITFTAKPIGFDATVLWSITSGGTLSGSGKNVRTMAASSMTATSVRVIATITYEGQVYIATKTIFKVTDGKTGTDADPVDMTPEALVAALEGRIVKSSLYPDLLTLIDGPDADPTTLPGKIKKETDLRVGAINQEISDRIAALVAEAGARTTYVQTYTYSKQEVTSALSIQASAITAAYTAYADSTKAQAKADAAADVRAYAYSKGDIDSAEAAQTSTITTNYKSYADGVGATATSNANSYIQTYAYGKSTIDSTLASLATQLRSEFTDNNGVSVSYLNNYAFSKAETNSAIASATQTLSTTVGQHTTAIQQQFTSIDGLSAQLTWKIDNNGHVSGFGLASTPVNGVPYSIVIFNVDALAVALPGGGGKTIFTVGQVNGQSAAVFRAELMVDGGVTARMLKIGGSDNIIPDPKFYDLGWWGRVGAPVGDYTGMNNGWLGGAVMLIQPGFGGVRSSTSKVFTSTPGATMFVQVQVELSNDYVGNFSVFFYVEGGSLYSMGCPQVDTWANGDYPGWPIQFNGQSAKGRFSFSQEITIPLNSQCANAHMVIIDDTVAGNVAFGSCSATRVVDSTLIGPGVVETKHLIIDKGGAIYSGQAGFDLGDGFWLEGANADHGPRLSLGNSAGAKILADPRRGIFGLYNFPIINPQLSAKTITGLYSITGMNQLPNNTKQFLGSFTASMTNASGSVHYVWSAERSNGTITLVPSGSTCAVYGEAPTNGRCQGTVSCTGTDGVGFSAASDAAIDVGFGGGVPT